jgi:hypothetical protein
MNESSINNQIKKIYDALINSSKLIGNWAIVNNDIYKTINNKVTIKNINEIKVNTFNETIISVESKSKYYLIKYSPKFISIIVSDTEYGVFLQNITIFALNILTLNNQEDKVKYKHKDILRICGFKLSKRAIKDLDDFT